MAKHIQKIQSCQIYRSTVRSKYQFANGNPYFTFPRTGIDASYEILKILTYHEIANKYIFVHPNPKSLSRVSGKIMMFFHINKFLFCEAKKKKKPAEKTVINLSIKNVSSMLFYVSIRHMVFLIGESHDAIKSVIWVMLESSI